MNYSDLPAIVQRAKICGRRIVKIEWFTNKHSMNCEHSKVLIENKGFGSFEDTINQHVKESYFGKWDFCRVFDITDTPELYDEECAGICHSIKYIKHSELS